MMEVDHTIEFIVGDDSPATPRSRVHLVHALEAELDGTFTIMSDHPSPRILLVDDDQASRETLSEWVERQGDGARHGKW